jgi:hypothetical protein
MHDPTNDPMNDRVNRVSYSIESDWDGQEHVLGEMFVLVTDWTGRFPGGIEGCAGCHTPLEVVPGQRRVGSFVFHLWEPDLYCDECVARRRPDLLRDLDRTES